MTNAKPEANFSFELYYTKQIGGHPVHEFINQAPELEKRRDWTLQGNLGAIDAGWDSEAVFARIYNGIICGAMCFQRNRWNRTIQIAWVFVDPTHRRKGIHTAMFEAVRNIAIRDGYVNITRNAHINNENMIKAIEAQGGTKYRVSYYHNLLPQGITYMPAELEDRFCLVKSAVFPYSEREK